MLETHPFGFYIPNNPKYLLLGSFPGREPGDWFYGAKRSMFWPIMREIYNLSLSNVEEKQALFNSLEIAISDIILSCDRQNNSNLDINLKDIVINKKIHEVVEKHRLKKIFFSSRFVETLFRRHFKDLIKKYPQLELITLPSPSPRYAAMTKTQKIEKYKELLPKLKK